MLLYTHYVWFQIAVVIAISILLFYQNIIGANSLGKELSSLEILKYCVCVWENRFISGYAVHDCMISSNLYKQSGNTDTDDSTEQKGDIVIEMWGKYDFKVTHEVIEMMETESKVIVDWLYDFQILKGSSDKYNLNKDYVKVIHKRLRSSIGTTVTGFTKATITSTSGERTQFYAHTCF